MKQKGLFIAVMLLSVVLLSLSGVSAVNENIQQFLQDNVTQISVTVTQSTSWTNFSLDTSQTTFDHQTVNIQNETVGSTVINQLSLSFDISKLLGDINAQIEIQKDSDTPQFSSLNLLSGENHINGVVDIPSESVNLILTDFSTKSFLNLLFSSLSPGLNVSDKDSVNNYLTQHPLSTNSDRHIIFTKQETDYSVWNDKGYGDISSDFKQNIRDSIVNGVEAVSVSEIYDRILPFLEENNLNSSLFDSLNMNYTASVDTSSIQLKDGTYTIPVTINDGTTDYHKNIQLILQGIVNEDTDVPVVGGNYTPQNQEVGNYIVGVSGLQGDTVDAVLLDDVSTLPPNTLPSDTRSVIKYMQISIFNTTTGTNAVTSGTINFKIPTVNVANPSLLSLYVLEGSNWVKLSTSFIGTSGDFYEYTAFTPHFSTFMAMETQSVVTTTSGGGGGRSTRTTTPQTPPVFTTNTGTQTTPSGPTILTPPTTPQNPGGITGGVIGALTSPTGLVILISALVGIVVVSLIVRDSGGSRGKKGDEELNEKGDQDER